MSDQMAYTFLYVGCAMVIFPLWALALVVLRRELMRCFPSARMSAPLSLSLGIVNITVSLSTK